MPTRVNIAGSVRKSIGGAVLGLLAVSIVALLGYRFNLNLAATGLLQLLVVLLVALRIGFWEATAVSLFSNLCLVYFVIPPVFSLAIRDPENWVAMFVFELTALLVSRLSARAQTEAETANQRHGELQKLYEVSWQLLLLDKRADPGPQIVSLIRRVFPCDVVVLFDAASLKTHGAPGGIEPALESAVQNAYLTQQDFEHPQTNTWVRVLRLGEDPIGAMGMRGTGFTAATTNALASVAAISMERARAFENESQAEAKKRTEELRTAVLDALAHEFKTPLTVITTASNGLLAMDGLATAQRELLNRVDNEAAKLNELTTRLLQTARLDIRNEAIVKVSEATPERKYCLDLSR